MTVHKLTIPCSRLMPSFIFYKLIIRSQIHSKRLPTLRAFRDQILRNLHILLLLHHVSDHLFIFISHIRARFTALEQPIITLGIKKSLFIKTRLLETMIHIRCDDKIILILYQRKQMLIHRLRRIHISIDEDELRPVSPHLFRSIIRIKASGIHILKAVFLPELREVFLKTLAVINKARRGRKPCSCPDNGSISFFYRLL